jgi:hypothetical protein
VPAAQQCPLDVYANPSLGTPFKYRSLTLVSLRDVQRTFVFVAFFRGCAELVAGCADARRRSLLLAIGCVYYMRLDGKYRARFVEAMRQLPAEQIEALTLECALGDAMSHVLANAAVPRGIARTEGLKENVFMAFVCTLARVPLMIVGPPGSSKTLSIGVVETNARGAESPRHVCVAPSTPNARVPG